jgi:NADPH:quinone reductase-like Zn-dependent oxidoreductase
VTVTASRSKDTWLRALGADEVIDYAATDFTREAANIDVVFDLVGGDYGERSLGVLRPGGVLVTAVDPLNRQLADEAKRAGATFRGIMVEPDHVGLEAIAGLVDDGRLSVHVERTFSFDDVAEAHRFIEGGHVSGKVVLVPRP